MSRIKTKPDTSPALLAFSLWPQTLWFSPTLAHIGLFPAPPTCQACYFGPLNRLRPLSGKLSHQIAILLTPWHKLLCLCSNVSFVGRLTYTGFLKIILSLSLGPSIPGLSTQLFLSLQKANLLQYLQFSFFIMFILCLPFYIYKNMIIFSRAGILFFLVTIVSSSLE